MALWIILGVVYAAALLGHRRLGGFGTVADGLQEWGCAASDFRRRGTPRRSS